MAVEVAPSWEALPRATQDVIEWARACERTSRDVGTRALLVGILKAGGRGNPAAVLLRYFGVSDKELYRALQSRPKFVIDPDVATKSSLAELPPLTLNAQACLRQADATRGTAKRPTLDPDCLFGAILQSRGTAGVGLAQVLDGISLDLVANHYLGWLVAGKGSYAKALAEAFPQGRPTARPESSTWSNLMVLLRRQTQNESPYRAAGFGILMDDGSLLTTVAPSAADQARVDSGGVHQLEWTNGDDLLALANLVPPATKLHPLIIREALVGDTFRCYAVADDDSAILDVDALFSGEPPTNGLFELVLTEAVSAGFVLTGSPVLDSDGGLVGIVAAQSANRLQVVGSNAIVARRQSATAADQSTPQVSIGTSSGAGNDTVAETDQLGFGVYVEAFADLIMSEHTKPPLTIGIFGSWGMGKSFLLDHIRRTVEERQRLAPDDGPTIHPVCFNAWEYSATEAIWPALVRKIVKQLDELDSWPRHKRIWTRLSWNLRREWRPLWIKLVTTGLVLATLAAVALGKHQAFAALVTTIVALGLGGAVKAANDPVANWVTRLFLNADYGGQLRLMEDIKHDLDVLERRLHVAGDPDETRLTGRILVIIDDLDRCEPAKAVEVLQAVNLLLNFPSFIICLGIDARIITAAIEKHYEGLLGVAGASGYEYLDKIVQIPFRIPEPGAAEITEFIRTQLDLPADSAQPAEAAGIVAEAGSTDIEPPEAPSPVATAGFDNSERAAPAPQVDPGELARGRLARSEVLFTADELRAFQLFVPYLRPNPRHLKRLINVYRLVRSLGLAEGERLVLDRPAAVLRWLIMWAQWPLTSSLLLRRLDGAAADQPPDTDPMLSLLDEVERSIDRKARADRDDDPRKLRGLLDVSGCVLSVDEIRRIRRYTVNFNPAIEEQLRGSDGSPSELPEPA